MCPDCASNAFVWTLNSAIASEGGEKPTTPLLLPGVVLLGETRLGAPSSVNSLPPMAPLATMPARLPLSIGREKCRSEESKTPGARRLSMYAVPSPSGSCWIWLLSMTWPVTPEVVSSSGCAATTSITSSTPPVSRVRSTVSTSPTRTSIPLRTTRLEAVELRLDRVGAGDEVADLVLALAVRDHGAGDVRVQVRDRDGDAGQDAARGVGDGAVIGPRKS